MMEDGGKEDGGLMIEEWSDGVVKTYLYFGPAQLPKT